LAIGISGKINRADDKEQEYSKQEKDSFSQHLNYLLQIFLNLNLDYPAEPQTAFMYSTL
jgi:hypothetical protein